MYKLFYCCPSWATKIPVFSCLFPEVDTKHIIISLDIENYTWTDIQAGFVWFVKWQDAEGMETAGWISKGRSDVKNCASLSELFIAKWNTVTAKAIWSTTLTSWHFQAPLNVKRRSRFVMLYLWISVLHLLHRSNIMQSRKPRLCVCVVGADWNVRTWLYFTIFYWEGGEWSRHEADTCSSRPVLFWKGLESCKCHLFA